MMHDEDTSACSDCTLRSPDALERRAFLRDAVSRTLLAVGALGLLADRADALTVTFARGAGARTEKAYAIPAGNGVAIDKDESVIVARVENRVYAFSLACPHQHTAIRWEESNNRFQCPKHHSKYRADGSFIEGRATRGLDRFPVRLDGDMVLVNLDVLYQQDDNAAQWAAAFVDLPTCKT